MIRDLQIEIRGHKYTISSPNIGNIIDFEGKKASLSNGNYNAMLRTGTYWSVYALDLVDMIAFYTVFVPKLLEDSNVKSFRELNVFDLQELKQLYLDILSPWYLEVGQLLGVIPKEEAETPENEQGE